MELAKTNTAKVVDGGKFCADCGGRCCRSCAGATGYFNQAMHTPDFERFTLVELTLIEELRNAEYVNALTPITHPAYRLGELLGVEFNHKTGFGGPTGCRLPREKRSRTCLRYFCPELAKHIGIDYRHVYWSATTDEERAANERIFGTDVKDSGWGTPITKYIELMKGKKNLAPTT